MIWTNGTLFGLFLTLYMLPGFVWLCTSHPAGRGMSLFQSIHLGYGERVACSALVATGIFLLSGGSF
jgi:hypothetical protein